MKLPTARVRIYPGLHRWGFYLPNEDSYGAIHLGAIVIHYGLSTPRDRRARRFMRAERKRLGI